MAIILLTLIAAEYFCMWRTMCTADGIFLPSWMSISVILIFILSLLLSIFSYLSSINSDKNKLGYLRYMVFFYLMLIFAFLLYTITVLITFANDPSTEWSKMSKVS